MSETDTCPKCGGEYADLRQHRHYKTECKPDEWPECPQCGEKYNKIGQHWSIGQCTHPPLSQHQIEITTGLLMGDGSLERCDKHASLRAKMITPEYLDYLDGKFGVFSVGKSLCTTAEESAFNCRESGFSPNASPQDYSDLYRWRTRNHAGLDQFRSWYNTGKKVWPDDIALTPTVLKHWFCGDGSREETPYGQNRIHIAMSNEIDNTEKVDRMFSNSDLPKPSEYNINQRKDGSFSCMARFTMEDSHLLWDYMGEPLPGFEYKWP